MIKISNVNEFRHEIIFAMQPHCIVTCVLVGVDFWQVILSQFFSGFIILSYLVL